MKKFIEQTDEHMYVRRYREWTCRDTEYEKLAVASQYELSELLDGDGVRHSQRVYSAHFSNIRTAKGASRLEPCDG